MFISGLGYALLVWVGLCTFGLGWVMHFWVGLGYALLVWVGLCTFHSVEFFPCEATSYSVDSSFVLISGGNMVFSLDFNSEKYSFVLISGGKYDL